LDMKSTPSTPPGQDWAGHIEVKKAYDWDPASYLPGVGEADIVGVEAPLWTETIRTLADIEFMTLPRLAGVAEIGWTPRLARNWRGDKGRLATPEPPPKSLGTPFFPPPPL